LILNPVSFRQFLTTSKDTFVFLHFYLKKILNLVIFDLRCSSNDMQEFCGLHGGKISKKVNALGNAKDTVNYISQRKYIIRWPGIKNSGQKPNLRCLRKNPLYTIRYYSFVKDEPNLSVKMVKRQLKNNNMLIWPDNKMLGIIREEVFKQQIELVHLADVYGLHSNKLFKKQDLLFNSLFFKIIAIDKLSKSYGSQTAGIDNIKFASNKKDKNLYLKLLESISQKLKHPNSYEASPVRRMWVPKSNGKMRPLGIPTIEDRALQHLVNLVLEPLVEMTSDQHNFGFRPYKSAKQAVAYLRAQLRTRNKESVKSRTSKSNTKNNLFELLPEDKIILDADIKSFFDKINHDWLISNLFLHPNIILFIKNWLKSRFFDKKVFFETEMGTPQGGVISPTLANFTLNGLEKAITNSLKPLTKSKEQRIVIHLKDGTKTRVASALSYVRFADDFIVLARSKHIMNNYVIPSINNFLEIRGLSLNNEKTSIFKLSDKNAQLDFLGYTFKYNQKWKIKAHVFYSQHAGSRGIALYPNKKKVHEFIDKIKFIFKKSNNLDAYRLIAKLNPILRGWSNYYNMANSSHYRSTVRNAIYRLTWKWASKKHKRWGRKLIAKTYFLTENLNNMPNLKSKNYIKIKNTKYVFHGIVKNESRYNAGKHKTIYLVDVCNISQLLSSKHFNLPKKLLNIHGYHSDYMEIVTFNTNLKLKSAGIDSSFKERLLAKQNNLCTHCKQPLLNFDGFYGDFKFHIHHIKPIFRGGPRNIISNMMILHSWCHYEINHKNESAG
jgi:RNA-directed DNA polymerase